MKVLFLDHPEADFLAAMVYLGLCQELGAENVVDYPYKRSYHGEVHRYPSNYVRDPGSNWDNGEGVTAPFAWFQAQPGREWSRDEVLSRMGEFALVVLASPRRNNVNALLDLASGRSLPPIVFVDGEDYEEVRWDLLRRIWSRVYFKRELVPNPKVVFHADKAIMEGKIPIKPISFAAVAEHPRPEGMPFEYDVALLGGTNRPGGRAPLEEAIRRVTPRHVIGNVGFDEYLATLAKSRIAIVPRGHGWDTLRFWETLSVEGPMMVADRMPLQMVSPPADGEQYATFGSPEELEAVLRRYLGDESSRARVAANGFAHFREYHTARARARYLLRESGVL